MNVKFTKLNSIGLVFVFTLISLLAYAQPPCPPGQNSTGVTMTFDPPPDPGGSWDAGQTVEICVEVDGYQSTGANWVHGFAFDFHPLWDVSSVVVIDFPDVCGNVNPSEWLWMPNGVNGFGPGFYFDGQTSGPFDGDPGNNWGDFCGSAQWDFCIQISLGPPSGDPLNCGGGGLYDGEDVTPTILVTGDGDTGSWGTPQTCLPTIDNPPVITVNCCDANPGESPGVLNICENGSFCLFDELLGTPDVGGFWDGPAGWTWDGDPQCAIFDPTSDPPGEYIYNVLGTDLCVNSVSIFMEYIDLGIVQTIAYCDPAPPCLTTLVTAVTLPPGGDWFYPDGSSVTGCTVDPNTDPAGIYTYEYMDGSNCLTIASLDLLFSPSGASGCFTVYDYCSDIGSICPLDILGCGPSGGGQWLLFDNNNSFGAFYPTSDICVTNADIEAALAPYNIEDGFFFVYALGAFPCAPSYDTLVVNYNVPFDPGLFTQTSICVTDPIVDLVTLLDGTPNPGGQWTDLDTSLPFTDNPLDPSTYPPNTVLNLLYQGGLAGTSCENSALLELTILPADADAGNPNSITVCESDPPFDMFTQLLPSANGPQPGGDWSGPLGPLTGSFFTPSDPANFPSGTYTYTITSSCDSDVNTLDITVVSEPDAGGDGTLDICDNATNVPLSDGLNPAGDLGGSWVDAASNPVAGGTVNGASVTNGESYFYIITNGPCTDSAEVVINLLPSPDPGVLTTTPQAFCETDGVLDLMTLFTTPPSSSNPNFWTGPGGPTGGFFDPSSDPGGLYTYTIPDLGCGSASVSINISLETIPNAGIDGNLAACPNDCTPVNLLTELVGATPGGTWTGPGGPMSGIFDPCSDAAGVYTYTLSSAPNGLCTDQATVTVSFVALSDPGTNGAITLCDSDAPVNLFDELGGTPNGGGFWTGPAFLGGGSLGTFDPASNPSGTYTYNIIDGSCPAVTADVAVSVLPEPDAGQNTVEIVCETFGNVNLFSLLNGTPEATGSWTDIGGNPVSDPFDVTNLCSATPTLFTYTVDNGTCSNSATLTLTIECAPQAGPDVTEEICGDGNPFDLNSILHPSADGSGTWTPGGNIIILDAASSGVYTYTVLGNVCADDQATYTLNIDDPITTSNITALCQPNQTEYVVCFDISGGDGNYSVAGPPGAIIGNQFCSDPIPAGTPFSFDVSDGGPCTDVNVSGASPNCVCAATAAWATGNLTICQGETVDLPLTLVGSGPFTIGYQDGTNPAPVPGLFDGDAIQVSPITTTTYNLVSVEDANCIGTAIGSVTVTVDLQTDAGGGGTFEYCGDGSALDLGTVLPGGTDPGTWSGPAGGPIITLDVANAGVYTYTTIANACPADADNYIINIEPTLSTSALSALCEANQTEYAVCFDIAGGDGNYSVTGAPGTVTGNQFCSDPIPAGTPYNFTVSSTGLCADVVVAGPSPNCNCSATATITSGNETICLGSSTDIIIESNGNGPFNVTYNDGSGPIDLIGIGSPYSLNVSPTTTTTYSLVSMSDIDCDGSVVGSVTISVDGPTDPGPGGIFDYCGDGAALDLNSLTGGADAGTWSGPAGGPVITLVPANAGVYTYTTSPNACPSETADYIINIEETLSTVGLTALCEANQTEYVLCFDIVGGDGNYTVSGITGNLTGNQFCSDPIPVGTPYAGTISSTGLCPDITVNGASPNCNCVAQGSITGSAELCAGDCANITFSLTGNGPFDVELSNSGGGSETFTGITDGYVHVVCPTSGVIYTLTSIQDSDCEGTVNGNPVTINVDQPVTVSNIEQICDGTNQFYTLSFEIAGGNNNYLITPQNGSPLGSLNGNIYSVDIPTGDGYTYNVTSSGNSCPPVIVELNAFDCGCATDAGDVSTAPLSGCAGDCIQALHFGNEFLDDNDALQFVLHNGTATSLGGVIDINDDGLFCLNYPEIEPGITYYINPIAGNADPFGNVDFNDPCLSVNEGVAVIQNATPTASISGGDLICPGDEVDLTITFTGTGPWTFQLVRDGDNVGGVQVSATDTFTYPTGIAGTYTVESASDDNSCSALVFGQATIQNYQTPTAIISGDPNICENSGDGPTVNFTGTPPFTFIYSIDGEEQGGPQTVNSNSYTIPAQVSGSYTLVSLVDANCGGSVQGVVNVNLIAEPTATISGGGVVCEGNEAVFNVVASGTAPYIINYTVGGFPQDPIISDSPNITFQSGLNGDYVITSVQDANCTGNSDSQASLVVNPLPTAELNSSASVFCIGQEVDISLFLEGNPPFNVTYSINGDTVTATGVQSGFVQTLQPNEPVFAEVLFIEDASTPTCSSEPQSTIFLAPTELPNAPVLLNDTMCTAEFSRQIGVTPVEGLEYSWSPAANLTDANIGNPEFVPPSIPGGQTREFQYTLTASNGDCVATDTMSIFVDAGPVARFSYNPNPLTTEETLALFQNGTVGNMNTIFYWEFDTLETSDLYEPSFKFPDGVEANYTVTLTATDPLTGCFDVYTERVEVRPELLIFTPSAFTPDNDGLNDLWGPVISNVDENDYRLTVLDRWGNIVFETRDPNKKWNGGKGNSDYFVEPGVYIWIIETKELNSLDEITQKGHVTVIR